MAAQIVDPQATSEIGDGTYFNFTVVTEPDDHRGQPGRRDWKFVIPPTTHSFE